MKIFQITVGSEKGGENLTILNGLAESAHEAITEAIKIVEKKGIIDAYPSRVIEIGNRDF